VFGRPPCNGWERPWFSYYNTSLSELGNTQTNGNVAFVFDVGLGLAGLLMLAFAVLVSSRTPGHKVLVWTVPLAVTAIDLAMVGVFPENTPGSVHRAVSAVLFLMISVTLLAYGFLSLAFGPRRVGSIALALGLFNAFIWLATWLVIAALRMTGFPQPQRFVEKIALLDGHQHEGDVRR